MYYRQGVAEIKMQSTAHDIQQQMRHNGHTLRNYCYSSSYEDVFL